MTTIEEPVQRHLFSLIEDEGEPALWFSSVLLGILGCKTIYMSMKAFSPLWFTSYSKLSKSEKIEWDNRAFSTAHAIVVAASATYLIFISDFFRDDAPYGPVVFRSSTFSQVILGVSAGYFISDLAMILWFYPMLGGKEYIVHHLLSIISVSLSLFSGQAHVYIYFVLFSEITTPLVNLRWYLMAAGKKNSKAYILNGLFLFFGWLFARVLLFVYFFFHIYSHYDQVKRIFPTGFYFLFIAPPSLGLMNLFWFYKLARGLVRLLAKQA